jgi:hypothetical protein
MKKYILVQKCSPQLEEEHNSRKIVDNLWSYLKFSTILQIALHVIFFP